EWGPFLTGRLAQGEPAELIGRQGYARYRRQIIGVGDNTVVGRAADGKDFAFALVAGETAAIELFPDPLVSSYRLRAEISQTGAAAPKPDASWVGLFFGTTAWTAGRQTYRCQC